MYIIIKITTENYLIGEPEVKVSVIGKGENKQDLIQKMFEDVAAFYGWQDPKDFFAECQEEINEGISRGYVEFAPEEDEFGRMAYWTVKEI